MSDFWATTLFIYIMGAVIALLLSFVFFDAIEDGAPSFEAACVLVPFIVLLWPTLAVAGAGFGVCVAGSVLITGTCDLFWWVFPKKVKLPKARVRK